MQLLFTFRRSYYTQMSEFVLGLRSLVLSYEIGTFRFYNLFSVFNYCLLVMILSDSDYRFVLGFKVPILGYYAIIIFMIPEVVLDFSLLKHFYEIITV